MKEDGLTGHLFVFDTRSNPADISVIFVFSDTKQYFTHLMGGAFLLAMFKLLTFSQHNKA